MEAYRTHPVINLCAYCLCRHVGAYYLDAKRGDDGKWMDSTKGPVDYTNWPDGIQPPQDDENKCAVLRL